MRLIGRCGLGAVVVITLLCASSATAASVPITHSAGSHPPNFVLTNASGNDFQIESAATGKVVKDIGPIAGYTNNGLTLSPDGRDLYVTVNRNGSLRIERITLGTGQQTFVADGEQPSISQNGRLLAYGTGSVGSQELVVRDLGSGTIRSINLHGLLGRQTDLLNASITWIGMRIVVLPGGVGNDLMGGPMPIPTPKSCSAVAPSATCLIVVNVRNGHPLDAKRIVLPGVRAGNAIAGSTGSSDLVLAAFDGHRTAVYKVDVVDPAHTVSRLFVLPSGLPVAFDAEGTDLLYLVGHGPVALWIGKLSTHQLKESRMLNSDVTLGGIAW